MRELGPLVAAANFHYDEKRVQVCWRELSQIPNLWETKKKEKTHAKEKQSHAQDSIYVVRQFAYIHGVARISLLSGNNTKYNPCNSVGIFTEGGVDCSFVVVWYKKVCAMERLKINFMEFGPRWRLLRSIPNS